MSHIYITFVSSFIPVECTHKHTKSFFYHTYTDSRNWFSHSSFSLTTGSPLRLYMYLYVSRIQCVLTLCTVLTSVVSVTSCTDHSRSCRRVLLKSTYSQIERKESHVEKHVGHDLAWHPPQRTRNSCLRQENFIQDDCSHREIQFHDSISSC